MHPDTKSKTTFKTDGNFAIHVTDLNKAENFYSEILGFRLTSRSGQQLVYDTGVVCLYVNKDEHITPFIPALAVKDYQQAKAYLVSHGCRIIKEFDGHKALYFTDPFGLTMDIIEKK
jgi:predicted enzyme related to lactoylglutathione lyase